MGLHPLDLLRWQSEFGGNELAAMSILYEGVEDGLVNWAVVVEAHFHLDRVRLDFLALEEAAGCDHGENAAHQLSVELEQHLCRHVVDEVVVEDLRVRVHGFLVRLRHALSKYPRVLRVVQQVDVSQLAPLSSALPHDLKQLALLPLTKFLLDKTSCRHIHGN